MPVALETSSETCRLRPMPVGSSSFVPPCCSVGKRLRKPLFLSFMNPKINQRADKRISTWNALASGRHSDPFSVLGVHRVGDGYIVRTLQP